MSKRVMVASRAVRRGRRLKARSTMPPPPKAAAAPKNEAIEDEPSGEMAVESPSAPESGEGLVGERRPSDAPAAQAEPDEKLERPATLRGEHDAPIAEETDEDDDVLDRISGYSRPPAPAFEFAVDEDAGVVEDDDAETSRLDDDEGLDGASPPTDVEMDFDDQDEEPAVLTPITRKVMPEEGEDPNATTLISVPSPRPASTPPPPSQITIEEAAPSSERLHALDDEEDDDAGFVPEGDEPPLSEPSAGGPAPVSVEPSPSSPIADVRVGYRDEDASLAPVVDDLALEEDTELAVFDAAAERRRDKFRRGVAGVLAAIVLGTVTLITVSALRGGDDGVQAAPPPPAPAEAPAPVAADEAPAEAVLAQEGVATPDEAQDAEEVVDGDYEALSTQTLELLNDREFDGARELAERLVALQPDNAFGYRCLGSALQDMGKIEEARDVYSQCVSKATKGEVTECRALGGAKR